MFTSLMGQFRNEGGKHLMFVLVSDDKLYAFFFSYPFIRETQFFQTKCSKNCQSNNPGEAGGYNTPLLCSGRWVQGLPWGFIPVISKRYINMSLLLSFNEKLPEYCHEN